MTRRFTPAGFCIVPAGHSVPAVRQKGAYPAGTLGEAGRHRVGRGVSSVRGLRLDDRRDDRGRRRFLVSHRPSITPGAGRRRPCPSAHDSEASPFRRSRARRRNERDNNRHVISASGLVRRLSRRAQRSGGRLKRLLKAADIVAGHPKDDARPVHKLFSRMKPGTDNAWKSLTTKTAALDPIDRWPQQKATVDPESTITRRGGCFRQDQRSATVTTSNRIGALAEGD
jgi:hypothetical protein